MKDTRSQSESLFDLQSVSYSYRGQKAIDSVSLKVHKGDRIAILGANGSGKSTLLRLLVGLVFPTNGSINAFGKPLTETTLYPDGFWFRSRVGFVFQDPDIQLFLPTVGDEVRFAPRQLGLSFDEIETRVTYAYDLLNIAHLDSRPPHLLSGGEKKKVAIATVLTQKPDVWIFDEPTASLDPRSACAVVDFIIGISERGGTVITATHDLQFLADIASKVLVLSEDHKAVGFDTPEKTMGNSNFLEKHNLLHIHKHSHGTVNHVHKHTHSTHHA